MDLYQTLVSLPREFLQRDDTATIVPAFEFNLPQNTECKTFTSCINKSRHAPFITHSIKDKIPSKKADVLRCVEEGKCNRFRVKSRTHVASSLFSHSQSYHFDEWNTLPESTYVTPLPCMENDIQEPYIFVKKTERLPHFDERFVNYGKNKVQWIIHLRLLGYKYYVLSQSFAIDVPHPK